MVYSSVDCLKNNYVCLKIQSQGSKYWSYLHWSQHSVLYLSGASSISFVLPLFLQELSLYYQVSRQLTILVVYLGLVEFIWSQLQNRSKLFFINGASFIHVYLELVPKQANIFESMELAPLLAEYTWSWLQNRGQLFFINGASFIIGVYLELAPKQRQTFFINGASSISGVYLELAPIQGTKIFRSMELAPLLAKHICSWLQNR